MAQVRKLPTLLLLLVVLCVALVLTDRFTISVDAHGVTATERRPPETQVVEDHHNHDHDHEGHDHDDHEHVDQRALKGTGAAHHDHDHDHDHDGHDAPPSTANAQLNRFSFVVWAEALFATALVGAAPVIVLLFVPLGIGNMDTQKPLLRVFLSFAAGGLLGDALLHLLPHSMPSGHEGHDHDHHHDHAHGEKEGHTHSIEDLAVWLWTIAGMMTFLILEKFVRAQTYGGGGHSHGGHAHGSSASSVTKDSASSSNSTRKRTTHKAKDDNDAEPVNAQSTDNEIRVYQPIAAAGYLNLAADFSHNFTDGLAIGATFLRGSGWQTTLAMLLHEVPHEIGDFAILIQSGFTRREAMLTQFLTAVGAMIGTIIGLLMEGAGDSNSAWISPFTAGGFIYIACASVMPELLEDCSFLQSVKEVAAMCAGVGLMILIALNE